MQYSLLCKNTLKDIFFRRLTPAAGAAPGLAGLAADLVRGPQRAGEAVGLGQQAVGVAVATRPLAVILQPVAVQAVAPVHQPPHQDLAAAARPRRAHALTHRTYRHARVGWAASRYHSTEFRPHVIPPVSGRLTQSLVVEF